MFRAAQIASDLFVENFRSCFMKFRTRVAKVVGFVGRDGFSRRFRADSVSEHLP